MSNLILNSKVDASELLSSLTLLDLINEKRVSNGEQPIRRNDFAERVFDELEGEHYESFVVKNPNGTVSWVASLTLDQCMLVSMRESKAVRRDVLAILKEARTPVFAIPVTFSEALMLASRQAEQIEEQQTALLLAAPKVEHFDKYVARDNLRSLTDVAKSMGLSAVKLGRLLREHGMAFKRTDKMVWMQWFVDKGYGVIKQVAANDKDRDQPFITNAGDAYIKAQFGERAA
ncbi:phage antirepressor KilAC domain-containing protein [Janthinobacterium sp. B9-8]|uniref:phage antirepressor KilAC domain-containing protein n=1 Tax=Janthinobacterium sp. B9-8 TaxID=1236179 RepID=UPI00069B32A1|nr:phage antirepressor KilAC domain-containing protein [Janthinobacterium sp. B9-8]AMC34756.1 hypothetical protein VN23_09110 [Janthinobacterium sp. B9-8]